MWQTRPLTLVFNKKTQVPPLLEQDGPKTFPIPLKYFYFLL